MNVQRRSLSKGQKAMIVARVQKLNSRDAAQAAGVSLGRIGQAQSVIAHAPDLVDAVITGATGLDAAYATAVERTRDAEATEANMARLAAAAPDLAERAATAKTPRGGRPVDPSSRSQFSTWLRSRFSGIPPQRTYQLLDAHRITTEFLQRVEITPTTEYQMRPLKLLTRTAYGSGVRIPASAVGVTSP